MTLYIKNANFVDWQALDFKSTHIEVDQGIDGSIRFLDALPDHISSAQVFDAKGKIVTKSFACGHHHIYATLARGMPAPARTPTNFVEILKYVWWNLDKNLDLEMIRASALAAALYCAKNGVTFIIDHHASPFSLQDSLFTIKDAFDSVGVSHLLCYEISDRDGEGIRDKGLEETQNYLAAGNAGHVGLHASFTVKDTLLEKAVSMADAFSTGIHIHVAEDKADQEHCLKDYNKRVVKRLSEAGVLDMRKTILGHCLHLDEDEKELLRNSSAWIAQNVESNLNNNVGLTDYSAYGEKVMLGTDGMHCDMLRSAKTAFFVGQTTESISCSDAYKRFRNVHNYISKNKFKGDGENNLVILDYPSPTDIHSDNFLGHFIFGIDSCHVDSTIASGRFIVKEKQLVSADEQEILGVARQMAGRLWKKLS